MSLTLTTAPTVEPVSLDDLKGWLGYTAADDDNLLLQLIRSAREYIERVMWRQFITATYTWKLDRFACVLYVPRPPLIAVTSITYLDDTGTSQTLATTEYQVIAGDDGRIVEAYDKVWPTTRCQPDAVTIVYTAGYGTSQYDVPEPVRQAILMTASHWYRHRDCSDAVMPMAARAAVEAFLVRDERRLVGV